MKNTIIFMLYLTSLSFLYGCATAPQVKINTELNPAVNTSGYQTFAWLKKEQLLVPAPEISPITTFKIARAIETTLINQGYRLVENNADFTVSFTVGSRNKINVSSYPAPYQSFGWGRGYYGRYHTRHMGMTSSTEVRSYTEGHLAIDFYDVNSKQPVWHGWASKRISKQDNKNKDTLINEVVSRLLGKFNPK